MSVMTWSSSAPRWGRLHLRFQLMAWSFFLFIKLLMLSTMDQATGPKILNVFVGILVTALVSQGIWALAHRVGLADGLRGRLVAAIIALNITGGALVAVALQPLERWAALASPETVLPPATLAGLVVFFSMKLTLWSVFAAAFFFYDRARIAEVERARFETIAREAELNLLRLQINPHLLFNSLATLRALVDLKPAVARDGITRLSVMLRYALQSSGRATVPLEEELAMVESFLHIEALRFGDRLRVSATLGADVKSCLVPPLSLQALVENAVKFGVSNRREGGAVSYSVVRRAGTLRLTVTNSGRVDTPSDSTGLGLKNLRARLNHLYGPAARLRLVQRAENYVVAELELPIASALNSSA